MSMVTQHYQDQWAPRPVDFGPWPSRTLSPCSWDEYLELKRKAAEYDRLTAQPDCHDPGKQEFEAAIVQVLRERFGIEPKTEALGPVETDADRLRLEIAQALGKPIP